MRRRVWRSHCSVFSPEYCTLSSAVEPQILCLPCGTEWNIDW